MKRILFFIGCGLTITALVGCSVIKQMTQSPTAKTNANTSIAILPPYSGPKAKIAVADFEIKTTKATLEIGSGLREMLVTALLDSNRFLIVERQELSTVIQRQELSTAGAVQTGSSLEKDKIKIAGLIINMAIAEFEPEASGGSAGVGGGGGVGSGTFGGLLNKALNKAHMALDISIIDSSTAKILATTQVQGQASDVSGAIMTGLFEKQSDNAALSAYVNTPMEKAMRICIIEAVRYIVQIIPGNYYKD